MSIVFALVSLIIVLAVNVAFIVASLYAFYLGNKYAKMHTVWELMAEVLSPIGSKSAKAFMSKLVRVIVLVIPALAIKLLRTGAAWAIRVGATIAVGIADAVSFGKSDPATTDSKSK